MSDAPLSRVEEILEGTYSGVPLSRVEELLLEGGGGGEAAIRKIIVDELPVTGINEGAIYLVPGANPSEGNQYDEYVHTPHGWEMISTADDGDIPDDYINNLWS